MITCNNYEIKTLVSVRHPIVGTCLEYSVRCSSSTPIFQWKWSNSFGICSIPLPFHHITSKLNCSLPLSGWYHSFPRLRICLSLARGRVMFSMSEIELSNESSQPHQVPIVQLLCWTLKRMSPSRCRFRRLLSVELPMCGLDKRVTESDEGVAQKNVVVREELATQKSGRMRVRRRGNALCCG